MLPSAFISVSPGNAACAIKAVDEWLMAANITQGPIFRSMLNPR
jgi:hypothetical protein